MAQTQLSDTMFNFNDRMENVEWFKNVYNMKSNLQIGNDFNLAQCEDEMRELIENWSEEKEMHVKAFVKSDTCLGKIFVYGQSSQERMDKADQQLMEVEKKLEDAKILVSKMELEVEKSRYFAEEVKQSFKDYEQRVSFARNRFYL